MTKREPPIDLDQLKSDDELVEQLRERLPEERPDKLRQMLAAWRDEAQK